MRQIYDLTAWMVCSMPTVQHGTHLHQVRTHRVWHTHVPA